MADVSPDAYMEPLGHFFWVGLLLLLIYASVLRFVRGSRPQSSFDEETEKAAPLLRFLRIKLSGDGVFSIHGMGRIGGLTTWGLLAGLFFPWLIVLQSFVLGLIMSLVEGWSVGEGVSYVQHGMAILLNPITAVEPQTGFGTFIAPFIAIYVYVFFNTLLAVASSTRFVALLKQAMPSRFWFFLMVQDVFTPGFLLLLMLFFGLCLASLEDWRVKDSFFQTLGHATTGGNLFSTVKATNTWTLVMNIWLISAMVSVSGILVGVTSSHPVVQYTVALFEGHDEVLDEDDDSDWVDDRDLYADQASDDEDIDVIMTPKGNALEDLLRDMHHQDDPLPKDALHECTAPRTAQNRAADAAQRSDPLDDPEETVARAAEVSPTENSDELLQVKAQLREAERLAKASVERERNLSAHLVEVEQRAQSAELQLKNAEARTTHAQEQLHELMRNMEGAEELARTAEAQTKNAEEQLNELRTMRQQQMQRLRDDQLKQGTSGIAMGYSLPQAQAARLSALGIAPPTPTTQGFSPGWKSSSVGSPGRSEGQHSDLPRPKADEAVRAQRLPVMSGIHRKVASHITPKIKPLAKKQPNLAERMLDAKAKEAIATRAAYEEQAKSLAMWLRDAEAGRCEAEARAMRQEQRAREAEVRLADAQRSVAEANAIATDALRARGGQMHLEQVLEERPVTYSSQPVMRQVSPRSALPGQRTPASASASAPASMPTSVPSSARDHSARDHSARDHLARNYQDQQIDTERSQGDQRAAYERNSGPRSCWSPRNCG